MVNLSNSVSLIFLPNIISNAVILISVDNTDENACPFESVLKKRFEHLNNKDQRNAPVKPNKTIPTIENHIESFKALEKPDMSEFNV